MGGAGEFQMGRIDLNDYVSLITGSGRGIGYTTARKLAEHGSKVVLSDYDEKSLENASAEFKKLGFDFISISCDVTKPDQVNSMVDKILEKFGKIDILVNNAGITRDTLIIRMNEEQWDQVLNTNLKGTFLVTQAVSKIMVKQKFGRIINISSVVGITGNAGQCNYSASKAGVIGFSKSIAKELASRNITVNVIAPGFIETEMTAGLPDNIKHDYLNKIPLKKAGKPENVADAVLFFASPLAEYITGQVLNIDGGMVM